MSEGTTNTSGTLIKVAIIGLLIAAAAGAFAVGLGSNPGNPNTDQLSNKGADAGSPQIKTEIAALEVKIDGCKDVVNNKKYLNSLSTNLTDEASYDLAINKAAKTPAAAAAARDKVHAFITAGSTSLSKLLALVDSCSSAANVSSNTQVPGLWADVKKNVDGLRNEIAIDLNGAYNFPGVEQGMHQYCQQASAAMVALTYLSNYGATPFTQADVSGLPANFLKAVQTGTDATSEPKSWGRYNGDVNAVVTAIKSSHAPVAWFTTPVSPPVCIAVGVAAAAPGFLNKIGASVPNDWVLIGDKDTLGGQPIIATTPANTADLHSKGLAAIKLSVTNIPPDPVIVDSTNSSACSYTHIIPLFQYSNNLFLTNNPGPGSIKFNQTSCGSHQLNDTNVGNFSRLVIRKVYLQKVGLLP